VKISQKMLLFLIVVTLLLGMVGLHALFSNQIFVDSARELEIYEDIVDAATESSCYAKKAESHLFLYLTLGNPADKQKFFDAQFHLNEKIHVLENSVTDFGAVEQVEYLKTFSVKLLEYGSLLIRIYDQNPAEFSFEQEYDLVTNSYYVSSGARMAGDSIVRTETRALNLKIERLEISGDALRRGIVATLTILLITVPSMGILVSRSITIPLRKLKATSVALGNGALGIQSDLKLDDEIGDLVVSFNKMSSDLQVNQRRLLEAERHSAIETATWVGHDLRNPLQAIQNTKYLIKENISKLPDSSDVRRNVEPLLQRIDVSIQYSEGIIRNLKDFGNKEKPRQTTTDLNALIKKTLSKAILPEGIEVIEELTDVPKIAVDEEMMGRVFMNLVTNAVQAMEDGGRLKVSTKKTKDFVEISFQDTGNGMSEGLIKKIFEPFFTTKAKGMGIGLAICKKFVEANSGIISVESEKGKGSKFTVKLPY
jgi:signal transduction histidine kinase